jgi:hypothetical protein
MSQPRRANRLARLLNRGPQINRLLETDDLAKLVATLAGDIAVRTKHLAMRKKGRPFTDRAIRQWLRAKYADSVHMILREAFREAGVAVPAKIDDKTLRSVLGILYDDWQRLNRPVGRPGRGRGLINSTASAAAPVSSKKMVGRRPLLPLETQRKLVYFVAGVRVKRLMISEGFNDYAGVRRYIVGPNPKGEARREMIKAISDAEALKIFVKHRGNDKDLLPEDFITLKSILQNARRHVVVKLPLKLKSGG